MVVVLIHWNQLHPVLLPWLKDYQFRHVCYLCYRSKDTKQNLSFFALLVLAVRRMRRCPSK